jgi:ubiquinone/menaquinone biosynthesis C-methylase UbiE
MSPRDYFSSCSSQYAAFRPRYPPSLFTWLSSVSSAHQRVWDCACGNGQASVDLAGHFQEIYGTDLSAEQIAHAEAHPRVNYRVGLAEASGLPDNFVDLVTVAQALHWFDLPRFYQEARRVARPGALLAVWSYGVCELPAAHGNAELQDFYSNIVGPYWTPERRLVESGYQTLEFPAPELQPPAFAMQLQWSLEQLLGYVGSWSASARYLKERGEDPVPKLRSALSAKWGEATREHTVQWPLSVRAAALTP